ncbi:hypothetical protein NLX86_22610 [Streptomyces sp. A3M-1-3]|uniref:hypothetical protein n=1 Tax=Streptomyces sp. A3M-1-3 TaxID=2962044 RepID=UPI0020B8058C|nr:hypothetical protein [Streptomyces sp. A3M-1-3]MCP3820784.1 hypothetical protein [Streptomyces sp. A3M-1-3]
MSRETDSSSSGPQGRGGAAYPSGTPPYGTRQYPSLHPSGPDAPEERAEPPAPPQPEEKKTETTLTTRIRINIPGSRPIPPVVMRTPMSDSDAAAAAGDSGERTGSSKLPEGGAEPAAARQEEAAAEEPQAEEKASAWFAPRKPAPTAPVPAPAAGANGTNGRNGSGPAGAQPPSAPGGGGARPDLPYFSAAAQQNGPSAQNGPSPQNGQAAQNRPAGPPSAGTAPRPAGNGFAPPPDAPRPGLRPPGAAAGPTGPTTGPASGDMPLLPPAFRQGGEVPAGPPRMSDDTAVLTPQRPAPTPPDRAHVSGDTLTSGIPAVPPSHHSPFAPPTQAGGPRPDLAPLDGSPSGPRPDLAPAPAPAPRASAPAKKGRSKLVLAGVGVFGLLGVAYGAGLLLNHSEVPKGTTVLGVDIGGGTKEEAVGKLDAAFGKRAAQPLQLTVGGDQVELKPDKAGLTLDSQETVRAAAGSDYNPVSVISSLFGGERVAQPVIPVDAEKLQVALTDLAGVSGSATEGTIRFEPGKAVAAPGKSGKSLDVGRSMISVKDAYRAQVATGRAGAVELPVVSKEPTINKAALDQAMQDFAQPAMSGLVTVSAGGKSIQFGPTKSLPKFLGMKAVDGKLVETYNLEELKKLYGSVFDGVLIQRGNGDKTAVTPQDVAGVLAKILRGKTPAERTGVIETNPS